MVSGHPAPSETGPKNPQIAGFLLPDVPNRRFAVCPVAIPAFQRGRITRRSNGQRNSPNNAGSASVQSPPGAEDGVRCTECRTQNPDNDVRNAEHRTQSPNDAAQNPERRIRSPADDLRNPEYHVQNPDDRVQHSERRATGCIHAARNPIPLAAQPSTDAGGSVRRAVLPNRADSPCRSPSRP